MDRRQCHMDKVRNVMVRYSALVVAVVAVAGLIGGFGGEASASVACTNGGGVQSPGLCTISAAVTTPCPYVLALPAGEDLLITSTGSIKCDGPGAASGQNSRWTTQLPGRGEASLRHRAGLAARRGQSVWRASRRAASAASAP